MDKITMDVIGVFGKQLNFQNELMKSADMFEKGKHLGEWTRFAVGTNNTKETLKHIVFNTRNAIEQAGGYALFVAINKVNDEVPFHFDYYLKEDVRAVSLVEKGQLKGWITFKDMLEQIGYKAVTDKSMRVTDVS